MSGIVFIVLTIGLLFVIFMIIAIKDGATIDLNKKIPALSFGELEQQQVAAMQEASFKNYYNNDNDIKKITNRVESIPLELSFFINRNDFEIFMADGDSARPCGVNSGDMVLIKKNIKTYKSGDIAIIYPQNNNNLKARKLERKANNEECVDNENKPKCSIGECWVTRCEKTNIEKFHCENRFLGIVVKKYSEENRKWLKITSY